MPRRRKINNKGGLERTYTAHPTCARFHASNARVRFLMGPWNSGKSSSCVIELFTRACEQQPGPDNVRRSRWVITRDSYPNLKNTTIKDFTQWLPPSKFGEIRWDIPITYHMEFGLGDGTTVDAEFVFLALDRPDDVDKLFSLQVTGAWINECRFTSKVILDHLEGRVGRYPDKQDGWPTWAGVILDTNPPDGDHWMAKLDEDVATYRETGKPPEKDEDLFQKFIASQDDILQQAVTQDHVAYDDYEFFKQPGGLDPEAENLENIRDGRKYYERLATKGDPNFVRTLVHGQYGAAEDGRPIYPEFREHAEINGMWVPWHVSQEPLEPMKGLPILIGVDFGLTPALVIGQQLPDGQVRILQEIVSTAIAPRGIGIRRFIRTAVSWWLNHRYYGYRRIVTGDPAGAQRVQTDEQTCYEILRAEGLPAEEAPTNSFLPRREAVAYFLDNPTADGKPRLLIDPSCRYLIRGFKGGYRYKRTKIEGQERYTEKPDKVGNPFSHPHDALQYMCLRLDSLKQAQTMKKAVGAVPPPPPVP